MTNYEMALKNFKRKLWTEDMLRKLVSKGRLSEEELEKILNGEEECTECNK